LIEHRTHYDQLKRVPEWELWRRLEELERRLEKVTVLTEERDKHISKVKEVKRLGW
jgi:fructose-1,6-bisphosphatase/sedoheptulose 1,7-bisphosphatase-like protein